MAATSWKRAGKAELHLPCRIDLHPLVGLRRPGDVAAQLLQPLAVVCLDPHRTMQAEPIDVGAQGLARCPLARHRAPQGQRVVRRRHRAATAEHRE